MNVYGPRIKQARNLAGLTQDELAERLSVNVNTIKRHESEKGKAPRVVDRIAIAQVTGIALDFIEGVIQDPLDAADDVVRKLREHEKQIAAQEKASTELRAALAELAADSLRRTRELEARLDRDHPPALDEGHHR